MTTTFIISYIVLALIIVGVINLLLIRSRRKAKRQQKEQHFATRQSNQSKFKASDLDRKPINRHNIRRVKRHVLTIKTIRIKLV